ncbi:MAG TPA: hypothetical protein VHC22_27950 [Pirellulales bacterium]|nr:hypothetical protein [Pirellulales bacterium]
MKSVTLPVVVVLCLVSGIVPASELVLPQNRNAYLCREPIELAVAGLPAGGTAKIELVPKDAGATVVAFELKGDGSTVLVTLPPYALSAGEYALRLDGNDSGQKLVLAGGTNVSPMLLSQTIGWNDLKRSGANFVLGNAFAFGLLTPDGKPLVDGLRQRRSTGLNAFEQAIGMDLPTICYMYWTGYVTHKPWGSEKSWADARMVETMRLFNFHTAQRLRRYRHAIVSVGCLDEPGLAWGKTPAGGMASGFPNWDEQAWYESRGWRYTDDIASRDDADWMRYMAIRCAILKENAAQAKRDLQGVWPDVVFSTDLYAPHAIMDGTDPMNQEVNDVPSTHVFMDWGYGKLGVIGALYLEKAHQPTAKIAHAMNGQLFGKLVAQPGQQNAYRTMLNGMLAAGLKSNWWLNTGGMTPEELAAVNEPGQRLGPLFLEMSPEEHDVAVLWSFSEISLREKAISAKEAKKKTGEQIKLMVASLPENTALKEGQIDLSAYSVGGNYKEQVLTVHQALSRAGYPAHILDERLLPRGALARYKTLVVVGQTFELPDDVEQALRDFTSAGGRIVYDRTTSVRFDQGIATEADFKDPAFRWTPLFVADKKSFKSPREASFFQTNFFMDELARKAVEPLKKTLRDTPSKPAIVTDSVHLAAERHVGGEGQLILVLNGFERLPDVAESDEYPIYNHAAHDAQYTLSGLDPAAAVYLIEGADWRATRRVTDFDRPQSGTFAPGEMKLYLVAPRAPTGFARLSAEPDAGSVKLSAELTNLKMPWPFEITILGPDGKPVYHAYRAMNTQGRWQETFALGTNGRSGAYSVRIDALAGGFGTQTSFDYQPRPATPAQNAERVRVFDEVAIRGLLAGKPEIRIAIGSDVQRAAAETLRAALVAGGVHVQVVAEGDIVRKARYPRVWDPYIKIHKPTGAERKPSSEVKLAATVETADDGRQIVRTAEGQEIVEWRKPGTLLTVAGQGFIDFDSEKFFEPGCVVFIGDDQQPAVVKGEAVEVQASEEVRQKWSRPWTRLNSFVGTDKLCPQLPEAFSIDSHLILLGDSRASELVAALQASELLLEVADEKYPGPGKALLSVAFSPFAVEKNVILVGASDAAGLEAGIGKLMELAK